MRKKKIPAVIDRLFWPYFCKTIELLCKIIQRRYYCDGGECGGKYLSFSKVLNELFFLVFIMLK